MPTIVKRKQQIHKQKQTEENDIASHVPKHKVLQID